MSTEPKPESNPIVAALREATEGLLYMSESDEPFEVVLWPGDDKPLDETKLLTLAGRRPKTPVKVTELDDFFAELTKEQDWYGPEEKADMMRYRKLLEVIKAHLQGVRVYRIGRLEVEIYIIGPTSEGDWAGVKTKAVET